MPDEIPADLCDVANQIVCRFNNTRGDDLAVEIFQALMAERERAALLVEQRPGSIPERQEIASAIRRGTPHAS